MDDKHIITLFEFEGNDFITACYRNVLAREPDPIGASYYRGLLASGSSKHCIIAALATSIEYKTSGKPHPPALRQIIKIARQEQSIFRLASTKTTARHRQQLLYQLATLGQHLKNATANSNLALNEITKRSDELVTLLHSALSQRSNEPPPMRSGDGPSAAANCGLPLSEQNVRDAFQEVLGREPESNAVIDHHRQLPTIQALRSALIDSPEFKARLVNLSEGAKAQAQQILHYVKLR